MPDVTGTWLMSRTHRRKLAESRGKTAAVHRMGTVANFMDAELWLCHIQCKRVDADPLAPQNDLRGRRC